MNHFGLRVLHGVSSFCFGAQYRKNLVFPADSLDVFIQVVILMNKEDSFKHALISISQFLRMKYYVYSLLPVETFS